MAEDADLGELPRATVVPPKHTRISPVWIIPILAAVVAIGVAVQRILSEGPSITIVFRSAEGVEAGKTFVKYKDVNIGQVTAVRLSEDFAKVEVTAKITKSAAGLMVEDAKFWVVRPRITLSGISGLGTLLSGNYIGFEAGSSKNSERKFNGLEVPPVITGGMVGRQFLLKASDLGSLGIGSPVYYRRLQVGQVVAYDLAADGKAVELKVFVNAPVRQVRQARDALLERQRSGHLARRERIRRAHRVPGGAAGGRTRVRHTRLPAAGRAGGREHRVQPLQRPGRRDEAAGVHRHALRALFQGAAARAVGGGAGDLLRPAGGRGHRRGAEVRSGHAECHPAGGHRLLPRASDRAPALGAAARGRAPSSRARRRATRCCSAWWSSAACARSCRSGSLLTGQLYVAFDYFPNAPKAKVDWNREAPELPVTASTLPDIENKLTSILAKLDRLPLEAIGKDLRKDLQALHQTLEDASKLLTRVDSEIVPALKTTLEEARRTLAATERVMKGAEATLVGPNAAGQQELREALQEVARAARSLRVLTDYLERHPEALIRGKTEQKGGRN